ncbi:unnamed protein product [Protopolystoma xenopodis]|uniref:Pre-mRNA-splicing factor 38 n=1 Tax=Protopolystoma xenopodis TaxID=117903 RepID=A0A448WZD6_9PLAT|nr:unnamed protein product [Protopolystoma xenopodis]
MANRTVKDAHTIHGTNPQYLVEKIIRSRIYESKYWKEHCFAITSELLVDKAVELRYVGGVYGGNVRPTPFLCLSLKMLQIQPDKDIVIEFIKQENYKSVLEETNLLDPRQSLLDEDLEDLQFAEEIDALSETDDRPIPRERDKKRVRDHDSPDRHRDRERDRDRRRHRLREESPLSIKRDRRDREDRDYARERHRDRDDKERERRHEKERR